MNDLRKSSALADDLAAQTLTALRESGNTLDVVFGVSALFTACATLVALLPESEWDDTARELAAALPGAIRKRGAKLLEAGVIQSRATRQ